MFIQVGSWWYQKDKELQKHKHKDFNRVANRTQESVYVRKGSMQVTLYSEKLEFLENFDLFEGDLAVFAYGGMDTKFLKMTLKL